MFIFSSFIMKDSKLVLLIFLFWLVFCWSFSFAWSSLVWNLLWTQLEIWLNQRSNINLIEWDVSNALSVQQQVVNWNQYDLVWALDKAKTEQERLNILDQYIASLSSSVSNWTSLQNYENSQVDFYKNEVKRCEAPIKSKNSEFSNAVKSYNYEKAESISKEIAEMRACAARNEVYVKAHASYASAAKSLSSLQKRVDYLSKNKQKIAKYYEILKPDLLKELYDISKVVDENF